MVVTNRSVLMLLAAAAALSACDSARNAAVATATTTCTSCHGGTDDLSGAPPNDLHGNTAPSAPGVGGHTAHVAAGLRCASCHPDHSAVKSPLHMDGKVDVVLSGLAVAGGSVPAPKFDPATGTCSNVYCHGVTMRSSIQRSPPTWIQSATGAGCVRCHDFPPVALGHPPATECASCHPTTVAPDGSLVAGGAHLNGVVDATAQHPQGYAGRSSGSFHGPDAVAFLQGGRGVRDCRSCHGTDLAGGVGPSCTACHASAGWVTPAWSSNCTFCHGTPTKGFVFDADLARAAPPPDVAGAAAGEKVGAHGAHLAGTVSSRVTCATCHAVPTQAAPLDHLDGASPVAVAGVAGAIGPGSYDATARTCTTACHGPAGSPAWTSATPIGCGGCHGAPPATGRHPGHEPKHAFMGENCGICHADTAGVAPSIVDPSRHLNGAVDVRLVIGTFDGTGCAVACHGTFTPFPWANP